MTPPRVLVVDDDPVGRRSVRALLAPEGYAVAEAADGEAGLAAALADPPDVVLLDVMMPGVDGFEVCRRLRADPATANVPVLLITALDDSASIVAGLDAGADDFVSKPFDRAVLRARVRTVVRLNRYRKARDAERLRAAVAVAAGVQRQLLPAAPPAVPGFALAARCRFCEAMGGDLYDFVPLPGGRVGVAVGDVAGHGVGAALTMAVALTVLRTTAPAAPGPGEVLAALNDHLVRAATDDAPFVTLFYGVLDPAARTLAWASAGHEPGFLGRAGGGVDELPAAAPPLGIAPGLDFPCGPPLRLGPGDRVLVWSDGLCDATDPAGAAFGRARLRAAFAAGIRPADLLAAIDAFRGPARQPDDMTAVEITALPPEPLP